MYISREFESILFDILYTTTKVFQFFSASVQSSKVLDTNTVSLFDGNTHCIMNFNQIWSSVCSSSFVSLVENSVEKQCVLF